MTIAQILVRAVYEHWAFKQAAGRRGGVTREKAFQAYLAGVRIGYSLAKGGASNTPFDSAFLPSEQAAIDFIGSAEPKAKAGEAQP